eukprot:TRINITY_DN100817_c0_g1_i1.p1 TRINITY_DN100817_c0_g1~~TRINITY_DN100817_c0_g1_i1.p1  ORF type:complete len:183 (-),score=45.14 TRINITY_DN100817_c0_g1_i1:163-711(-)
MARNPFADLLENDSEESDSEEVTKPRLHQEALSALDGDFYSCSEAQSEASTWVTVDPQDSGVEASSGRSLRSSGNTSSGSICLFDEEDFASDFTVVKAKARPSAEEVLRKKAMAEEKSQVVVSKETILEDDDYADLWNRSHHGWTKNHKANHNAKIQRKVAAQTSKRAAQSRRDRGIPDDDE